MNDEEYHHLILKTLSSARVFKPQEEFAKKENLSKDWSRRPGRQGTDQCSGQRFHLHA